MLQGGSFGYVNEADTALPLYAAGVSSNEPLRLDASTWYVGGGPAFFRAAISGMAVSHRGGLFPPPGVAVCVE